jgi:signal transduction histidine kinase
MDTLYVIDGPMKGTAFSLKDGISTLGRDSDNDICVADIGASRHHAKLIKRDKKLLIVDLSSFRGVYIDGVRIEKGKEIELKKDHVLMIGSTILSFQKEVPKNKVGGLYPADAGRRETDRPRDHSRSLELLLKVSNIFAQSIDIEKLLDELMDQIFSLLKRIDRGVILLLDNESGELKEVVSKTRMGDELGSSEVNYSRTIVKRTIREREPVKMSNTSDVSRTELSDSIELMNVMSVMCVPITYKGEVRGAIYVDSIGLPYGFRDHDLLLLTGLSNTAAIALQNALLYEELRQELVERKRAEEELRDTCQQLQETRNMLVQSEKLAAIGRLTAGFAHEILNPTHIMSMRFQLLEMKEGLSKEIRRDLDVCRNQLNRIIKIIDDLRQFSRISEKHVTMNDLNGIVEHVLALNEPDFKKEDIRIEVTYDTDIPPIPFDKDRILQVIFNLMSNATEAMAGRKTKLLRIATGMLASEDYAQVRISDNGTGIDQDDIHKIFDPFFTTKDRAQGTGLGLYVCYKIVQEHGGRLWAENNEWGGASFFIELPVSARETS